jgi:hypothetical protein
MAMVRKQLYIDAELDRALKALSAGSGESEAAHVRAALRAYVSNPMTVAARPSPPRSRESPRTSLGGSPPRAAGQNQARRPYPFTDMAGKYQGGPADLAVNHDHYLYGAPKVEP